jgi:superfamily II DNA or RNA helicase
MDTTGLRGEEIRPTPGEARRARDEAGRLLGTARMLLAEHERARRDVMDVLEGVRAEQARAELASVPVARLKDVTGGRLRIGALEKAGFTDVRQVLEASAYELQLLPGIGAPTAAQLHSAARQLEQAARESTGIRIDVGRRDARTTTLLVALYRLVDAGPDLPRAVEAARELDRWVVPLLLEARPAFGRLRLLLTGGRRRRRAYAALAELTGELERVRLLETSLLLAQATTDLLRPPPSEFEAWTDFELRSPEYHTLLAELAGNGDDRPAAHGLLPGNLVAEVLAQRLDDAHRRVSLRGYQEFGARFALARRRVILGDEMGLGKSIEAIAALAHLRSEGDTHFLVVCPTSVLINWLREIESRSALKPFCLHGSGRAAARDAWEREGGVAVTTLDSLYRLEASPGVRIGMLVVDEAHFVKNPRTKRSQAVAEWCRRVERVLFLTGTPMENRVEEFRTLVSYLRPELAENLEIGYAAAGASAFRKAVAPVYLRRNQQDVLAELPELVETAEWVEFSGPDLDAYRAAVRARNFMAMRSAAYAVPKTSAKLKRLLEIVQEAEQNGLKVIVFSYFRDVLACVEEALGGRAHGPVSGSLPAERRQEVVDGFSAVQGHAVLLGQIQAGGVGLNLQAASVVLLCEPQLKPGVEAQAVARAHRMGQVRGVQVHRLLAADSVDQRLLRILGGKARLFDAYARRSDLAESAPDAALDVSEQSLAAQIIEEEQLRLAEGRPH